MKILTSRVVQMSNSSVPYDVEIPESAEVTKQGWAGIPLISLKKEDGASAYRTDCQGVTIEEATVPELLRSIADQMEAARGDGDE